MKKDYYIDICEKREVNFLINEHHYLSKEGLCKDFKSGVNFGLFFGGIDMGGGDYFGGELVGVCIFTGFPVPELSQSIFGLSRDDQDGLYELSRLCLNPKIQFSEHNIASWFVSRCLKKMKKEFKARAILSYSDNDHHKGTIYKACNFKYYGETSPKSDFFIEGLNGVYQKHSRGSVKGVKGEWRKRSIKKRFLIVFSKELKNKIKWQIKK